MSVITDKEFVDYRKAESAGTVENTDLLLLQRDNKQLKTTAADIFGAIPSTSLISGAFNLFSLVSLNATWQDLTGLVAGVVAGSWVVVFNGNFFNLEDTGHQAYVRLYDATHDVVLGTQQPISNATANAMTHGTYMWSIQTTELTSIKIQATCDTVSELETMSGTNFFYFGYVS